jgi:crotonobetainyl-CoA:carnitine CoA-transferase CaiB-like acyl-CoA transferase
VNVLLVSPAQLDLSKTVPRQRRRDGLVQMINRQKYSVKIDLHQIHRTRLLR